MSQVSGGTGYNYTHLSGAGTTTILAGIGASQATVTAPANVGLLGGVSVNTAGTTVQTISDRQNHHTGRDRRGHGSISCRGPSQLKSIGPSA